MAKNKNKPKNVPIKAAPNVDAYTTKIIAEFKDTQRAEIKKWRRAQATATDPETPRLYPLQDLCDNLKADGHFTGDIRIRKAATLCTRFSIVDKTTGEAQKEKTDFFKKKWFYDFMKIVLDSPLLGYTLIELTDTQKPRFKVIPRRNTVPTKQQVLLKVQDDKGVDFTPAVGRTLIEVGEPEELGLMADICGQLIWKRNAQQSWAEYSEKFGMPLVTATTNKTGDAEIARVRKMLSALGEAAQAVLPEGTKIDIKESSTGDAWQVFDKQIDRINSEISKAMLGGTMVTDDGSSRSQSEVHERNLDEKIAEDDRRIVTFTVNDQLIPMLALWGHGFDPQADEFQFDPADELTLKELWDIVYKALDKYDIPDEWVAKKFGVPITARKALQLPESTATTKQGFTANFQ